MAVLLHHDVTGPTPRARPVGLRRQHHRDVGTQPGHAEPDLPGGPPGSPRPRGFARGARPLPDRRPRGRRRRHPGRTLVDRSRMCGWRSSTPLMSRRWRRRQRPPNWSARTWPH